MTQHPDGTADSVRWTAFHTTHWSEILNAQSDDEPCRQGALAELLGRYWKPVYCFLRCRGNDKEKAKDLTQGFFHEIVWGRKLIQQADRTKGPFRRFLLAALHRYVISVHRAETAKQRMPEGGLVRLEDIGKLDLPEPVACTTPIQAFDYAWACTLMDEVVAELEEECRKRGKHVHWEVFWARVLQPFMDGTEPPSLAYLREKSGVSDMGKVSKMIIRTKRLFRNVVRRCVQRFVDSDAEVDEEIRYLIRVLSNPGGRL